MLLIITRTARSVTATGLSGVATVMRTSADLIAGVSSVLRPAPRTRAGVTATERAVEQVAPPARPSQLAERAKRAERQARVRAAERARTASDEEPQAAEQGAAAPDRGEEAGAPRAASDTEVTAEDIATTFEERGRVKDRTIVDVPEVTHAAASPSHIAELARGTVAQVVAEIDDLSTDELRQLLEHESTTKRRRGILDAIEQALTP